MKTSAGFKAWFFTLIFLALLIAVMGGCENFMFDNSENPFIENVETRVWNATAPELTVTFRPEDANGVTIGNITPAGTVSQKLKVPFHVVFTLADSAYAFLRWGAFDLVTGQELGPDVVSFSDFLALETDVTIQQERSNILIRPVAALRPDYDTSNPRDLKENVYRNQPVTIYFTRRIDPASFEFFPGVKEQMVNGKPVFKGISIKGRGSNGLSSTVLDFEEYFSPPVLNTEGAGNSLTLALRSASNLLPPGYMVSVTIDKSVHTLVDGFAVTMAQNKTFRYYVGNDNDTVPPRMIKTYFGEAWDKAPMAGPDGNINDAFADTESSANFEYPQNSADAIITRRIKSPDILIGLIATDNETITEYTRDVFLARVSDTVVQKSSDGGPGGTWADTEYRDIDYSTNRSSTFLSADPDLIGVVPYRLQRTVSDPALLEDGLIKLDVTIKDAVGNEKTLTYYLVYDKTPPDHSGVLPSYITVNGALTKDTKNWFGTSGGAINLSLASGVASAIKDTFDGIGTYRTWADQISLKMLFTLTPEAIPPVAPNSSSSAWVPISNTSFSITTGISSGTSKVWLWVKDDLDNISLAKDVSTISIDTTPPVISSYTTDWDKTNRQWNVVITAADKPDGENSGMFDDPLYTAGTRQSAYSITITNPAGLPSGAANNRFTNAGSGNSAATAVGSGTDTLKLTNTTGEFTFKVADNGSAFGGAFNDAVFNGNFPGASGNHNVSVELKDNVGNAATYARTLHHDNRKPEFKILAPGEYFKVFNGPASAPLAEAYSYTGSGTKKFFVNKSGLGNFNVRLHPDDTNPDLGVGLRMAGLLSKYDDGTENFQIIWRNRTDAPADPLSLDSSSALDRKYMSFNIFAIDKNDNYTFYPGTISSYYAYSGIGSTKLNGAPVGNIYDVPAEEADTRTLINTLNTTGTHFNVYYDGDGPMLVHGSSNNALVTGGTEVAGHQPKFTTSATHGFGASRAFVKSSPVITFEIEDIKSAGADEASGLTEDKAAWGYVTAPAQTAALSGNAAETYINTLISGITWTPFTAAQITSGKASLSFTVPSTGINKLSDSASAEWAGTSADGAKFMSVYLFFKDNAGNIVSAANRAFDSESSSSAAPYATNRFLNIHIPDGGGGFYNAFALDNTAPAFTGAPVIRNDASPIGGTDDDDKRYIRDGSVNEVGSGTEGFSPHASFKVTLANVQETGSGVKKIVLQSPVKLTGYGTALKINNVDTAVSFVQGGSAGAWTLTIELASPLRVKGDLTIAKTDGDNTIAVDDADRWDGQTVKTRAKLIDVFANEGAFSGDSNTLRLDQRGKPGSPTPDPEAENPWFDAVNAPALTGALNGAAEYTFDQNVIYEASFKEYGSGLKEIAFDTGKAFTSVEKVIYNNGVTDITLNSGTEFSYANRTITFAAGSAPFINRASASDHSDKYIKIYGTVFSGTGSEGAVYRIVPLSVKDQVNNAAGPYATGDTPPASGRQIILDSVDPAVAAGPAGFVFVKNDGSPTEISNADGTAELMVTFTEAGSGLHKLVFNEHVVADKSGGTVYDGASGTVTANMGTYTSAWDGSRTTITLTAPPKSTGASRTIRLKLELTGADGDKSITLREISDFAGHQVTGLSREAVVFLDQNKPVLSAAATIRDAAKAINDYSSGPVNFSTSFTETGSGLYQLTMSTDFVPPSSPSEILVDTQPYSYNSVDKQAEYTYKVSGQIITFNGTERPRGTDKLILIPGTLASDDTLKTVKIEQALDYALAAADNQPQAQITRDSAAPTLVSGNVTLEPGGGSGSKIGDGKPVKLTIRTTETGSGLARINLSVTDNSKPVTLAGTSGNVNVQLGAGPTYSLILQNSGTAAPYLDVGTLTYRPDGTTDLFITGLTAAVNPKEDADFYVSAKLTDRVGLESGTVQSSASLQIDPVKPVINGDVLLYKADDTDTYNSYIPSGKGITLVLNNVVETNSGLKAIKFVPSAGVTITKGAGDITLQIDGGSEETVPDSDWDNATKTLSGFSKVLDSGGHTVTIKGLTVSAAAGAVTNARVSVSLWDGLNDYSDPKESTTATRLIIDTLNPNISGGTLEGSPNFNDGTSNFSRGNVVYTVQFVENSGLLSLAVNGLSAISAVKAGSVDYTTGAADTKYTVNGTAPELTISFNGTAKPSAASATPIEIRGTLDGTDGSRTVKISGAADAVTNSFTSDAASAGIIRDTASAAVNSVTLQDSAGTTAPIFNGGGIKLTINATEAGSGVKTIALSASSVTNGPVTFDTAAAAHTVTVTLGGTTVNNVPVTGYGTDAVSISLAGLTPVLKPSSQDLVVSGLTASTASISDPTFKVSAVLTDNLDQGGSSVESGGSLTMDIAAPVIGGLVVLENTSGTGTSTLIKSGTALDLTINDITETGSGLKTITLKPSANITLGGTLTVAMGGDSLTGLALGGIPAERTIDVSSKNWKPNGTDDIVISGLTASTSASANVQITINVSVSDKASQSSGDTASNNTIFIDNLMPVIDGTAASTTLTGDPQASYNSTQYSSGSAVYTFKFTENSGLNSITVDGLASVSGVRVGSDDYTTGASDKKYTLSGTSPSFTISFTGTVKPTASVNTDLRITGTLPSGEGSKTVKLTGVTDIAGNVLTGDTAVKTITQDNTAPALGSAALTFAADDAEHIVLTMVNVVEAGSGIKTISISTGAGTDTVNLEGTTSTVKVKLGSGVEQAITAISGGGTSSVSLDVSGLNLAPSTGQALVVSGLKVTTADSNPSFTVTAVLSDRLDLSDAGSSATSGSLTLDTSPPVMGSVSVTNNADNSAYIANGGALKLTIEDVVEPASGLKIITLTSPTGITIGGSPLTAALGGDTRTVSLSGSGTTRTIDISSYNWAPNTQTDLVISGITITGTDTATPNSAVTPVSVGVTLTDMANKVNTGNSGTVNVDRTTPSVTNYPNLEHDAGDSDFIDEGATVKLTLTVTETGSGLSTITLTPTNSVSIADGTVTVTVNADSPVSSTITDNVIDVSGLNITGTNQSLVIAGIAVNGGTAGAETAFQLGTKLKDKVNNEMSAAVDSTGNVKIDRKAPTADTTVTLAPVNTAVSATVIGQDGLVKLTLTNVADSGVGGKVIQIASGTTGISVTGDASLTVDGNPATMDGSGVISYTFSSTAVSPVISGLKITGDTDTEDTGTQFNLTVQLIDFYDNISAAQNSTQIYLDREGPVIAAGTLAGSASAISGITAADGASQAGVYTTDFTSGYYEVSLHPDSAKTTMTTAPADIAMDYDSGSYRITYTLTFEADTQAVFQFRIMDKVGNRSAYNYAKLAMSGSSTYTVILGDSAAAAAWSMRIAGPVSVSGPSTPIAREALNIAASRSRNLAPPVTRAVQRRAAQAVEADNTLREAVSYTYVSNTQASRNYLKESVWRTAANTTVVRAVQNENAGTSAAESIQSSGASESAEAPLYLAVPASLTRPVENPGRGKDDTVKTSVKAPVRETESGKTVSAPRENINNAAFVSVLAGLVSGRSEAPAGQNPEKGGENGALGAIAPKAAPDGTIKRRARARGRRV